MDQLDNIQNLIYVIRGQRVMLDFDLARLSQAFPGTLLCPFPTRLLRRFLLRSLGTAF